jgi:ABC-type branched-subunit amino acid transport system substrate-binding protein
VGVTDSTITISVIGSFSGAVGAIVTAVYEAGFGTWLDDVNANGGIHGRRVVVKTIDDKSTPEGGVAACKEAQANGTLMTFVFRSTDDSAADCLNAARVPVFATVVTELKPWSHVRSLFLQSHRGVLVARYVKGGLGDGNKKLGVIYVNTAATEVAKNGYVAEAKRLGMTVVQVEAVQTNQASFTSELLRLKNAGAENVAMFVNTESIGVLRDAKLLGYEPRFTGVSWCVDEFSTAGGGLYEGIKCLRSFATTETPAYQAYREKATKYGRGGTATSTAMWAYGMGLVTGRVLEAAGKTPTRESLKAGYNSIKGYDTHIVPAASWAPDRIIGSYAELPVVCCNPDNTWKTAGIARDRY